MRQGRLREQRGWYWYDWAASAFSVSVVAIFLGPYLTDLAQAAQAQGDQITLFGLWSITAASYFPFVAAVAVSVQMVVVPVVGAVADSAPSRRVVLGLCTYVGALFVMALWFVHGANYQLGGVLFVVATVAFGSAMTVYNSFLPLIADSTERDRVSSMGWAMGYAGGVLLLVVNLLLFLNRDRLGLSQEDAVRIALVSAGAWWAIFAVIPLVRLGNQSRSTGEQGSAAGRGLREIREVVASLRMFPQACLFLVAFFFFNDGIQTMIGLSATYAVEELGLQTAVVLAGVIVVQVVGILGALILARLARRFGAKRVVLVSLGMWTVGVLGVYLLPERNPGAYLLAAAFVGFVLGGSQALSRSIFAQLTPRDRVGGFFALFEIAGSASALVGPLVFAVTLQVGDSYRVGLLFLILFFVVGGLVLARVDMVAGMRDAQRA